MSQENQPLAVHHDEPKLKLSSYVTGFILSVCLTLGAYLAVTNHGGSRDVLIGLVVALALAQFIVQALFFLHIGNETKPRWKLGAFFFMLGVVLILVFGSIWIMYNLNYHQMTLPEELQYMNNQDNL